MEKITSHQVLDLMEAYQSVYVPQEDLNEELIWEEVEFWVNSLVEEGYDLSEYSWEDMYEEYLSEKVSADPYGVSPGTRKVTSSVPVRPRPPSRGGSSDPYGASGAAGAPVRPRMSSDPYGVSPGTKRVGGVPAVRPPSRGGSSDPYGASGAARPSAGAPVRPKIGTLPSSARQVTQYPQGVSTGVGGGNAGASRPSAAPARSVARPSAPTAPRPAAGAPVAPARPVARPSAAPAARPAAAPAARPAAAPVRPAAAAPVTTARPSAAPTRPAAAAPVTVARPAAPTTGNPPLAPKPLPPIMGKPSLASQAAEIRAMRQRSQQRTIAQGGTPATALVQSFDPFDVVLGHLIDEGYADNEESALQIMTNMSEDWRESIIEEGYKRMNRGKIEKQAKRLGGDKEIILRSLSDIMDRPEFRKSSTSEARKNRAGSGSEYRKSKELKARDDAQADIKKYGLH